MSQLWKIRLPGGQVLEPGDYTSSQDLYSTVEFGSGAQATLAAFSYGPGGEVPGSIGPRNATIADTNLKGIGGRLPDNEELIAYTIHIEVFQIGPASDADASGLPVTDPPEVSLPDMLRMQRDVVVITRIADVKRYTEQPLSYFPAATGAWKFTSSSRTVASAGADGSVASNNGGVNVQDRRVYASPLYVGPGDVFKADFFPAPGQITNLSVPATGRMRMRIHYNGYRRLPVS